MLFLLGSIFVGCCYVGIPTASMVENHGNFYLAFMVKHTGSIDPASMLRHDIFHLAEPGILHPCILWSNLPFLPCFYHAYNDAFIFSAAGVWILFYLPHFTPFFYHH